MFKNMNLLFNHHFFSDKPEIDEHPTLLKFASDAGNTAKLICKAQASPLAKFSWARNGSPIAPNSTSKYYATFRQVKTSQSYLFSP